MMDRIKTINTFLLDEVLPVYFTYDGMWFVNAHHAVSVIWIRILLLPPVRAVIRGLRRLLSLCRHYRAPDPDEESEAR
jgi:hypothetical protein